MNSCMCMCMCAASLRKISAFFNLVFAFLSFLLIFVRSLILAFSLFYFYLLFIFILCMCMYCVEYVSVHRRATQAPSYTAHHPLSAHHFFNILIFTIQQVPPSQQLKHTFRGAFNTIWKFSTLTKNKNFFLNSMNELY